MMSILESLMDRKEPAQAFKSDGFTLLETMVVIAIMGIVGSMSVPSFMNWRRSQIVSDSTSSLATNIQSLTDDARRWGATCTISLNRYRHSVKPLDLTCVADGGLKSLEICGGRSRCNISAASKRIREIRTNEFGRNLISVTSNVPNVSITPRGQLASATDVVFVVNGTRELGGSVDSRCIVLRRVTGEIRLGRYNGFIQEPRIGSSPINGAVTSSSCL